MFFHWLLLRKFGGKRVFLTIFLVSSSRRFRVHVASLLVVGCSVLVFVV